MNFGKILVAGGAILVASVAIGVTAAPVHARASHAVVVTGFADEVVIRRVGYADLNLAALPGERTLNRRIGHAVTSLCDEAVGGRKIELSYMNCTYGAWRVARPQVALAVQRAQELAATGTSLIVATAISISVPD